MLNLYLASFALLAALLFGAGAMLWIRRRWFYLRGRPLPRMRVL